MNGSRRTVLYSSLLLLLTMGLAGGCGAQSVLLGAEGETLFLTRDVLTPPGQTVDLTARILAGDYLAGQEGLVVRFLRDGELYRSAETNSDGEASVSWTVPDRPGNYVFLAEVAPVGLAEDVPEPRRLLVAVRDRATPMVFIDMDKTLVASGFETVMIGDPEPMPGSQEVVKRLVRSYGVVYLTHRPEYFARKSKDWIRQQGYPAGPVLLSTTGGFLKGSRAFKSEQIAKYKAQFGSIRLGIGDKLSDAEAYLENDLRAIVILPVEDDADAEDLQELADELDGLDEQIDVVLTWQQVGRAVFDQTRYPPARMAALLRERAAGLEDDDD